MPKEIYEDIKKIINCISDGESLDNVANEIQKVKYFIKNKELANQKRLAYTKLQYCNKFGTEDEKLEARIKYLKLKNDVGDFFD